MALVDQIIGVESGGNPNAPLCTLPHMGDKFRADTLVGKLLFAGRPSAIFGGIIPISVNPVERMLLAWSRPHIGKEVFELIPSFANFYAFRSVMLIRNMFRQIAAPPHTIPNLVFSCRLTSARHRLAHSVSRVGLLSRFDLMATAAHGIARLKVWYGYNNKRPAFTSAYQAPDRCIAILSDLRVSLFGRGQPSELHSNVILAGH